MDTNQVKCALCDYMGTKTKMFQCSFQGRVTYECSDEKNCKIRVKAKEDADKIKYKNPHDRELEKFGITFEDLELSSMGNQLCRSYSDQYYCEKQDKYYTCESSVLGTIWYETKSEEKK